MRRHQSTRPDNAATAVLRLSQELAGLRRAQRSRSVIEQAKGVLMGRLNCSADQAFQQLTGISQETNTKVAEVAAGLLGMTAPVRPGDLREPGESPAVLPDQEAARYHLACAAMAAATNGDTVTEALLGEGLRPLGAAGALLAVREPDGTVRLVGSYGLPRGLVSSWQRLPAGLKVGFLTAADEGRPLWLSRDEALRAGLELFGAYEFRACLPLRRDDRVFGVAVVVWPDDPGLDLTGRAFVAALAAAAGRRLRQLTSADRTPVAAPAAHWLEAVLEALSGSFALLCPVTDRSGAIVDWRYDKCSPHARDALGHTGAELVGRRLLELHPQLAGGDVLRGYEEVLRTGRPFTHGPAREPLAALGRGAATTIWIRAARLGDGILVTWRHDDHRSVLLDRIGLLEETSPAGWARWSVQNGEVEWGPGNAAVLGRPQAMAIEELPQWAAPADRDRLAKAVLQVMQEHTDADLLVQVDDEDGPAPVRVVMAPVVDRRGRLTAVTAVFARHTDSPRPGTDASQPSRLASPYRSSPHPEQGRPLADTLHDLTAKVRQLRHEQDAQAIIDRAEGLISARLGCSIETALDNLSATARQRRVSLLEVAADVVGASPPSGPRTLPAGAGFRPETYLGRPARPEVQDDAISPTEDERVGRVRTALRAATDGDGVAAIVWDTALRRVGAHAVVLGVLEPDGAVRLIGSYGLPAGLADAWRRTPSSLNVAYLRAVATDRPLWITREEADARGYQLLGEGAFRGCVPLHQGGRIFGVASVQWSRPIDVDDDTRAYVTAVAEAAGRRLSELLRTAPHASVASPAAHWAETIVGALPPDYALLRPVRDAAGEVVDWRFELCSPDTVDVAGRSPDEMVGRHLHELYPHVLTTGIAAAYRAAMGAGTSAQWGPIEFDIETPHGPLTVTMSGRASKFGDGILIHWRREERDDLDRRLRMLEKATGSGWAEWDLAAGESAWSAAAYAILRRDPRRGPVKLGALHRYVVTPDEAAMTDAVRRLTRLNNPVDLVVRLQRHGDVTPVRFAARPVLDGHGRVSAVHAVFQGPTPA